MGRPSTINVLFTSLGRRVELVRAFRQAYEKLGLEGKILAVDMDPLAPGLHEVDLFHIVPRASDPGYIDLVVRICRQEAVDLLIPLIDEEMPVLVRHQGQLRTAGVQPLVLSQEAFPKTADKLLTYRFLRGLGVPTPQSWSPEEVNSVNPDYPVFVKPRFGSAGKHTVTVRNARELSLSLSHVPDPIVQEYLPGAEITNDVYCDFEGTVRSVVSRLRIEVRSGEVSKGKTVYDPDVMDNCVAIAKGLDARCPITVQCILREDRPYFTEVNPRFGGGVPLGIAAGVDSPQWLLALAAGRSVETPPLGSYKTDLYLTRFDDSIVMTQEQLDEFESRRFRP